MLKGVCEGGGGIVVVVVVWVAGWLRHGVVQACWKCLRPVLYIIDNT